MNEIHGTNNKVLEVDLSEKKYSVYTVSQEERKMYLGAKGLGLKLIYDRMKAGVDPLGEENIIAFMPGVMMGTGGPCTGRYHAVSKSPLTGIITTSSCGGPFGMHLKTAGWDGLLVKGKSEKPVYLDINSDGVEFKDAGDLWGLDILKTQEKLATKKSGSMMIGPGGENLVRFANIASGHRFLGRGGMGAVMGSKNLKAVIAHGGAYKIVPKNKELFDKQKKKATDYIKRNGPSNNYRDFGTSFNVNVTNKANILPVRNFSDGSDTEAHQISGQNMHEKHQTKYHTCKPCTIMCGHKGTFGGKTLPVPEFETVGLLGSNIGVFDSDKICEWNMICSEMGIDTISTGGTLAWVMEAGARGLIETDLKFGSPEGVSEAIYDIGNLNGFGKEMALGSRALAKKYGGEDFAIHVKGLEMAAYDPRGSFGQGLAYAVANRGACHLSAYLVSLEIFFKLLNPYTHRSKAKFTKFFENLTCCVNALQTCQFTMFAYTLEPPLTKYTPNLILGMLMQNIPDVALALMDISLYTKFWSATTGIDITNGEFLKAGERIHVLERYMNTREGISRKDDTLPARLLTEGRKSDAQNKTVPLDKMLDKYYKIRGFNSNGIPTEETLARLGIESEFSRLHKLKIQQAV